VNSSHRFAKCDQRTLLAKPGPFGATTSLREQALALTDRSRPQAEISSAANKQMNVIGHDHVPANGNIEVALGSLSKTNEG